MDEAIQSLHFSDMEARAHRIPQFVLYGEQAPSNTAEFVHVEEIAVRSGPHGWHIAPHVHPGLFQVLLLIDGTVDATIEQARMRRDGPVAITVHPSLVHAFAFTERARGYVLTVGQNVLFEAGANRTDLFSVLFVSPLAIALEAEALAQRMASLLESLAEETRWPRYGNALMLEWLARSLLLLLLRAHTDQAAAGQAGRHDFELFSRFRAAVEQHYRSGQRISFYAELLRVTPVRLNRLCLRLAARSAADIVNQRLMREACRQLAYSPATVASIGYALGFDDPAYVSRAFKRHAGMSPSEYRRRGLETLLTAAPPARPAP